MPTNINFVGKLDANHGTQVSFNLPKTLSLGTVKKSLDNNGLSEAEGCSYLALNTLNQAGVLGKASLVVNPSSFSERMVYADVPANSTLGDLIFSRATDAWRTNSQGLVQRVTWNLLQYSQTFNNAAWVNTNTTLSVNSAIAPNGTLTAANLVATTGNLQHSIQQNIAISQLGDLTFSCYVKNNGGNFVQLVVGAISFVNPNPYQNFNLQTGTLAGGSLPSSTITSVGDGWYRITVTSTNNATGTGSFFIIPILNGTTGRAVPFVGDGVNGVYIWGSQLTEGSSALEYFPTTDRQNVPRIDYSLGGCPTLLMEPQRTNIATGSNALSSGNNVLDLTTATANIYISPDGSQNAMRFTETVDNGRHGFYQYITIISQAYTISIFTKQTGRRYISLTSDFTGTSLNSFFDLQTKSIVSAAGYTCAIQDYGNGWLRLTATVTALAGFRFLIWGGSANGITASYVGSTSVSQTFWGLQCEAGTYPTSYIPTTTASVTRNVDVANKGGISSLLGQTEGTIFYDIHIPQPSGLGVQAFASITNDAGTLFYTAYINNTLSFDMYIGGTYTFALTTAIGLTAGRNRVALVYKAGAYKLFLNGVLSATSTNAAPITNTISKPGIGADKTPVYFYEFAAFKSALSDAECINITK